MSPLLDYGNVVDPASTRLTNTEQHRVFHLVRIGIRLHAQRGVRRAGPGRRARVAREVQR